MSVRRILDRCYWCGDPAVDEWYCAAHLWASRAKRKRPPVNGLERVSRDHAYWIDRLTPEQILELGSHLDGVRR